MCWPREGCVFVAGVAVGGCDSVPALGGGTAVLNVVGRFTWLVTALMPSKNMAHWAIKRLALSAARSEKRSPARGAMAVLDGSNDTMVISGGAMCSS
eukprot:15331146-Ditylum_brightwellii.AAC.1